MKVSLTKNDLFLLLMLMNDYILFRLDHGSEPTKNENKLVDKLWHGCQYYQRKEAENERN